MTMHAEFVHTGAAAGRRASTKNPMEVLARLRDSDSTASFENQFIKWRKAVERDEETNKAALLYAFRNYWTALDRDDAAKARKQESPAERRMREIEQKAKDHEQVEKFRQFVFLTMLMPNGKPAIDCTGAELMRFGNGWKRVALKIGKTTTLRASGLTEAQVRTMMA